MGEPSLAQPFGGGTPLACPSKALPVVLATDRLRTCLLPHLPVRLPPATLLYLLLCVARIQLLGAHSWAVEVQKRWRARGWPPLPPPSSDAYLTIL